MRAEHRAVRDGAGSSGSSSAEVKGLRHSATATVRQGTEGTVNLLC